MQEHHAPSSVDIGQDASDSIVFKVSPHLIDTAT